MPVWKLSAAIVQPVRSICVFASCAIAKMAVAYFVHIMVVQTWAKDTQARLENLSDLYPLRPICLSINEVKELVG